MEGVQMKEIKEVWQKYNHFSHILQDKEILEYDGESVGQKWKNDCLVDIWNAIDNLAKQLGWDKEGV
jgi:hypothetical protein